MNFALRTLVSRRVDNFPFPSAQVPFSRPELLGDMACKFDLAIQAGDTGRVKRPVRAVFRAAYRSEVEAWLLTPGERSRTDQNLVQQYLLELRDLSYADEPLMCVAEVVEDRRAAAMIAAVFLKYLVE
ncbi:hypothetical protein [Variovorax paradoxus]|uniref:hypothetical protein n=1 Tax=Variovorax paradoxus TaxID=34073 RepID=UPI00155F4C72